MPAPHETAYPRLKHSVSDKELQEFYTPSADDLALAADVAKGTGPKICFLILLKSFQRLGYFVQLHDLPKPIAQHISLLFGVHHGAIEWEAYDQSGTRRRHVALIREHLNVRPFDQAAQQTAEATFRSVAPTREDLADLVNAAIEELVRQRYELPGFRTLLDTARRIRAEINRGFYQSIWVVLGQQHRQSVDDAADRWGESPFALAEHQARSGRANLERIPPTRRAIEMAEVLAPPRGRAVIYNPTSQSSALCSGSCLP